MGSSCSTCTGRPGREEVSAATKAQLEAIQEKWRKRRELQAKWHQQRDGDDESSSAGDHASSTASTDLNHSMRRSSSPGIKSPREGPKEGFQPFKHRVDPNKSAERRERVRQRYNSLYSAGSQSSYTLHSEHSYNGDTFSTDQGVSGSGISTPLQNSSRLSFSANQPLPSMLKKRAFSSGSSNFSPSASLRMMTRSTIEEHQRRLDNDDAMLYGGIEDVVSKDASTSEGTESPPLHTTAGDEGTHRTTLARREEQYAPMVGQPSPHTGGGDPNNTSGSLAMPQFVDQTSQVEIAPSMMSPIFVEVAQDEFCAPHRRADDEATPSFTSYASPTLSPRLPNSSLDEAPQQAPDVNVGTMTPPEAGRVSPCHCLEGSGGWMPLASNLALHDALSDDGEDDALARSPRTGPLEADDPLAMACVSDRDELSLSSLEDTPPPVPREETTIPSVSASTNSGSHLAASKSTNPPTATTPGAKHEELPHYMPPPMQLPRAHRAASSPKHGAPRFSLSPPPPNTVSEHDYQMPAVMQVSTPLLGSTTPTTMVDSDQQVFGLPQPTTIQLPSIPPPGESECQPPLPCAVADPGDSLTSGASFSTTISPTAQSRRISSQATGSTINVPAHLSCTSFSNDKRLYSSLSGPTSPHTHSLHSFSTMSMSQHQSPKVVGLLKDEGKPLKHRDQLAKKPQAMPRMRLWNDL